LYLYGYRPDEVGIPEVLEVDPNFNLKSFSSPPVSGGRKPVRVSLGCHFIGAAIPVVDFRHPQTLLRGCRKRIGPVMPQSDPQLLAELHEYNYYFMRKYFTDCIIDPDDDLSIDSWLEGTNYPLYRKQQLKFGFDTCDDLMHKRHHEVKVHGKDESNTKFTEVRGIYARSDISKCKFGPVVSRISKKFFLHEQFFKKVPNDMRISVLKQRMSNNGIAWDTDFTSFESTFQKEQLSYECDFYRYCCQANPKAMEIMNEFIDVICGINICKNKYFKFNITCRRMSGEMNTSLGNSYFNLLLSSFIAIKSGNSEDEIMSSILIEGDDCLCKTTIVPDSSLYEKFGAKVKQNYYEDPCHASFCGMVFDFDSEQIIVDPIPKILNASYTNDSYLLSPQRKLNDLLKAKAMSLLYSYPGCPIIYSYAKYVLRYVGHCDATRILKTDLSDYEREKWLDILNTPIALIEPKPGTRLLMEEKFLIPIGAQLRIESFFDSLTLIEPYHCPEIMEYCKHEYIKYYDCYSNYSEYKDLVMLGEVFI
jgi:hypothetical protein